MTVENAEAARDILRRVQDACIGCESCTEACDLLQGAGLTIGDVASHALAGETSSPVVDVILRCTECGLCCADCPQSIDVREAIIAAREVLGSEGALPQSYYDLFDGTEFGLFEQYKRTYGISYEDIDRKDASTAFFPGCALSAYSPELVRRVLEWLNEHGIKAGIIDLCCGAGLAAGGMADSAEILHKRLADEVHRRGVTRLIIACPECYGHLEGLLDGVEIERLSSVLRRGGAKAPCTGCVAVHDSCADRESGVIGTDVRAMLSGCEVEEMEHSGSHSACCGSGGLVSCVDPDLCEARAAEHIGECYSSGATHLVTACMSCAERLSDAAELGDVVHYLELVFGIRVNWAVVKARMAALAEADTLHTISAAAVRDGVESVDTEPTRRHTVGTEATSEEPAHMEALNE